MLFLKLVLPTIFMTLLTSSMLRGETICYDYTVQKNGFTLIGINDRNITVNGTGNLAISLAIRSKESEFDLKQTHIKLDLGIKTGSATFTHAKYSKNTVNTLIPAILYNATTSTLPDIAIGENASTAGGTIKRLQRYFTEFNYNQTSNTLNAHFDFDLNTTIDFGSGDTQYTYSTDPNTTDGEIIINPCKSSSPYRPIWAQFNVERTDSDPNTNANIRFPLYTQIVGRDFDFSVVAYDGNSSTPKNVPVDTMVDVELIDVKPLIDQLFKCSSKLGSVIQPLGNGKRNIFVKLNANTSRTNETNTSDLILSNALENAAFRLWLLVDENNTIISNPCESSNNNTCYMQHVGPNIYDPLDQCDDTTCANYISPNDSSRTGCYACYRDFSAIAICSRDNFSVRPESYKVSIFDDNEGNGTSKIQLTSNASNTSVSLAAQYNYALEANATRFQSNTPAGQYNQDDVNGSLVFADKITCTDQDGSYSNYGFDNGKLVQGNQLDTKPIFSHHNVGKHLLRMIDKLWTRVDQTGFFDDNGVPLKPFPDVDDCNKNDGNTSVNGNTLSGCDIMSNFDTNHTNIALTFEPYKFDVNDVNLTLLPDNNVSFLLMNDFSSEYYTTEGNEINMSAHIEGIIEAQGADGGKLSNFTATCHTNDKNITLIIGRDTTPVNEVNLTSSRQNQDGSTPTFSDVFLQQKLTMGVADSQTVLGMDQNVSLSGLEFKDDEEGKARIILDLTFKKPPMSTHTVVNPIDVNYTWLLARDGNSSSFANLGSHIPEGNHTYNKPIIYYFAKLTPQKKIYGPTPKSWLKTPIFVDIYCDYDTTVCKDQFNLTILSYGNQDGPWFSATMYQPDGTGPIAALTALGDFDLDISLKNGEDASPSVLATNPTRAINVPFEHPNAKQEDVNVSLAGAARPSTVEVVVRPAPFLRYSSRTDPDGYMRYLVKFIGDSVWSGVGNVGKAIETSSSQLNSGRLSW